MKVPKIKAWVTVKIRAEKNTDGVGFWKEIPYYTLHSVFRFHSVEEARKLMDIIFKKCQEVTGQKEGHRIHWGEKTDE